MTWELGDDDMTGGWSVEAKDVSVNGSVLVIDQSKRAMSYLAVNKMGISMQHLSVLCS